MNELEQYICFLKQMDWYYEYSDDHRVWRQYNAIHTQILKMQKLVDKDMKIYQQYAPY